MSPERTPGDEAAGQSDQVYRGRVGSSNYFLLRSKSVDQNPPKDVQSGLGDGEPDAVETDGEILDSANVEMIPLGDKGVFADLYLKVTL